MINRQGRNVPDEWESAAEHERIRKTIIWPGEFGEIVAQALTDYRPLSAVRMSDGEDEVLLYCQSHLTTETMLRFPREWNDKFGVTGITCGEIGDRMKRAAREATYFAPDGERNFLRQHFGLRERLLHVTWPDDISNDVKAEWFKRAAHVAILCRSTESYEAICKYTPEAVQITHIPLGHWTESEEAIRSVEDSDARLVLYSGGPSGKYIGPELAKRGKVALDVGHAVHEWWK